MTAIPAPTVTAADIAAWYKARMAPRLPRKPRPDRNRATVEFYDAAATSIVPGRAPLV